MRIAIVNLTGGGFSGGQKKHLLSLLPRLAKHRYVDALLCVSPKGNDVASWFKESLSIEYGSCKPLNTSHLFHRPDAMMTECLKKFSPDIIFLPVDRYIRFGSIPVVNMVRNMEPFLPNMAGDTLQERFKKFVQRRLASESIRRSDHVIAVSGFVEEYLTTQMKLEQSKVTTVYHGLDHYHDRSDSKRPAGIPSEWRDGFLFTCGSVRPARGLEDIFKAFDYMKSINLSMRLVIAGTTLPGMKKYREGLVEWLAGRNLIENVCWAESLNEKEIRWCYENSSLFIMTSRIEACPNIAMEALSYGAISVAANNPPLPDFFNVNAEYYEPGNGRSLAEAIIKQLDLGSEQRKLLSKRAVESSKRFSWDSTADKTMNVLNQVYERSIRKSEYSA